MARARPFALAALAAAWLWAPAAPAAAQEATSAAAQEATSAAAQEAAPTEPGQGFAYALGRELMSPFCPGRTISSCPSDQAAELLQWMVLQEAAGATREEVVAMLEQRFGPEIHSSPEADGWGLAAWSLPIAALVVGAGLVVIVLRRMVGASEQAAPAEPPGPRPVAVGGSPASDDAELERLVDAEFAAGER